MKNSGEDASGNEQGPFSRYARLVLYFFFSCHCLFFSFFLFSLLFPLSCFFFFFSHLVLGNSRGFLPRNGLGFPGKGFSWRGRLVGLGFRKFGVRFWLGFGDFRFREDGLIRVCASVKILV